MTEFGLYSGGSVQLDLSCFVGLSVCPMLTHLTFGFAREWTPDSGLVALPQEFAQLLPHVRISLPCRTNLLPVIHGLAAQLKVLDIPGDYLDDTLPLAAALAACTQLERVSLYRITQPILDALVKLPALRYVETDYYEQDLRPHSLPNWQEFKLRDPESAFGEAYELESLAKLPVSTLQWLVVQQSTQTQVPPPSQSEDTTAMLLAAQKDAFAALGAVRNLQLSDEHYICVGDQAALHGLEPQAAGAIHLQNLNSTLTSMAPLRLARIPDDIILQQRDCPGCGQADLDDSTAAALGAAFGAYSADLSLCLDTWSVAPSFWQTLPQHLPRLSKLFVAVHNLSSASTTALATWLGSYQGEGLSVHLELPAARMAELCSALSLAHVSHERVDLMLPL